MRRATGFHVKTAIGLVVVGGCADTSVPDDTVPAVAAEVSSESTSSSAATSTTSTSAVTTSSTIAPTTTSTSTSTSTSTASTSTSSTSTSSTSTSTTSTTLAPGVIDLAAERLTLGLSVEGRPIVAERLGEIGGRRVLVIGVIHGNEDDGVAIVDQLRSAPAPDGVELWVVESMNPDGQAAGDRHNANQVDLNRNFPYNWGPLGEPGDGQYAGTGPASEPETQAMVAFIEQLRPDIVTWYHQDLFVVSPSTGSDGRIRERYAELSGLPMGEITGGTYTGIAATWARNELADQDSAAFIVELGESLSAEEAARHADAVRTIAAEG